MTDLKNIRAFIMAPVVCTLVHFALFKHFDLPFELSEEVRGYGDRHIHIMAFFCMTLVLFLGQKQWIVPLGIVVAMAVTLEVLQIWMPQRSANWHDLFASLAGIAIAFAVIMLINRLRSLRSA